MDSTVYFSISTDQPPFIGQGTKFKLRATLICSNDAGQLLMRLMSLKRKLCLSASWSLTIDRGRE